ncbi:hypothetical protein DITRI_Ditri17bG0122900 [Diplodiscus trichospermus]
MGRSPAYCKKEKGLKRGPWTAEEDKKLTAYIQQHGHGSWRALPEKAGLQRCGKSCRLRWINYLRPDIKRGKFSLQEEQTIIQLHALLGNRWSVIATHLPKRTDNEIKNHWNTHLKKRLIKMGIDPMTHKPQNNHTLGSLSPAKSIANLTHMAQWESARLEAEARFVRESSKLAPSPAATQPQKQLINKGSASSSARPRCLDVLKAWQGVVAGMFAFATQDLGSPTSTLNFPGGMLRATAAGSLGENTASEIGFTTSSDKSKRGTIDENDWKWLEKSNQMQQLEQTIDNPVIFTGSAWFDDDPLGVMEDLSEALVCNFGVVNSSMAVEKASESCSVNIGEIRNYWDSVLNSVNSPPPDSPAF